MTQSFNLSIIGSGVMARGVALVALLAGCPVRVWARRTESAKACRQSMDEALMQSVEKGKITGEQREIHLRNLSVTMDLSEACSGADLVLESVAEDLQVKQDLFVKLARVAPENAVLATNTSSLSVREIAVASGAPERVLGLHFFNPPVAMKLLELVVPDETDPHVESRARAFAEVLGRTVIRVKDSPGFATSRLSVCIGLEAARMVEEGVASAADIDTAMEIGYRHPMGPLKLGDHVGLDVRLAVADEIHRRLGREAFKAPAIMRHLVKAGKLGKKTGEGFHFWVR
ncbi:MAG: 3-hydroxyacyl-CoA dehydrogenase family protein [Planctomycetota bacterium]